MTDRILNVVIAWAAAWLPIRVAAPLPEEAWALALLMASPLLGVLLGIAIGQSLSESRA